MLMTKKTTSFKAALSFQNRTIANFYSVVEQQKLLLQRIHAVLPEAIAKHALHCVVHGKKLLIYTNNAAWASQLRFYNKAILAAIAQATSESISIMQIKIMIEPLQVAALSSRKPITPSAEKIALLHNFSLTIQDEQLRLALLKLSETLAKLSTSS